MIFLFTFLSISAILVATMAKSKPVVDETKGDNQNGNTNYNSVETKSILENTTIRQTIATYPTSETTPDPNLKHFKELAFHKLGTYSNLLQFEYDYIF